MKPFHLYIQHMIADTVRFLRQCQRDHMGQYTLLLLFQMEYKTSFLRHKLVFWVIPNFPSHPGNGIVQKSNSEARAYIDYLHVIDNQQTLFELSHRLEPRA